MKSKLIPILALPAVLFSACTTDSESSFSEVSSVTSIVKDSINIPDLYYRNVTFGMSESEVITAESSLSFHDDLTRSGVSEEHIIKCIVSNETVEIENDDAIISYIFADDSLVQIEYDIAVSYSIDEIINTPATQIYNKHTLAVSSVCGLPTNTSSETLTSFISMAASWEDTTPAIMIYTNQTTDNFNDDEITDDVYITFAYFET